MRQAADDTQPIGLRYMAFRHALTHSHLGFHQACEIARERFGIVAGAPVASAALARAAQFFLSERHAWQQLEQARIAYIRTCKALGLPSPVTRTVRNWSKLSRVPTPPKK
ncbi:hypothetical protein [Niveibacterium umoris]|uniref:Uncharacterized protein n=1 Tax=Niveibacterium umoris TaxID=1193620 RepID=A0A840BN71_9RHOO|nr:hypothetical protein [Niveibacterium umoris]MBB4014961.1 hypothetical protein [Niveibacterium umoris]